MAEFQVTTLEDSVDENDGVTSLREALILANGNADADLITFQTDLTGELVLTQGQITISQSITIRHDAESFGQPALAIDGRGEDRIFHITGGAVEIEGLTLTNGYAGYDLRRAEGGGAILADPGTEITLRRSALSSNDAGIYGAGGGIRADGAIVNLIDTRVVGNRADIGGGVSVSAGTLVIANSALDGNSSNSIGGGVHAELTNLYVATSTLALNRATTLGGAIHASSGETRVAQSTLAGNSSGGEAGAIAIDDLSGGQPILRIANSIVTGNVAGSPNAYGVDVSEPAAMTGGNIIGTGIYIEAERIGTTSAEDVFSNFTRNTPVLSFDAGPVPIVALNPDGPAIDAADAALVPLDLFDRDEDGTLAEASVLDAQGALRIQGTAPDLGAAEAASEMLTVTTLADETLQGSDLLDEASDGNGLSLREAIGLANLRGTATTITFADTLSGGRISLVEGQLTSTTDLTILGDLDGDGIRDVRISGRGQSRILEAAGNDLIIDGLGFENGNAEDGGAIFKGSGGSLTITNSRFISNQLAPVQFGAATGEGGAIRTLAPTRIEDSVFRSNGDFVAANTYGSADQSGGGAISASGGLAVIDSTFDGNTVDGLGGAILNDGGRLTIEGSRFSGNSADEMGGGVFTDTSADVLTSRFIGNSAGGNFTTYVSGQGGGLATGTASGEVLSINETLFESNSVSASPGVFQADGGGVFSAFSDTQIQNSIFRENSAFDGGGVSLGDQRNATATIANTSFLANSAEYGAGLTIDNSGQSFAAITNATFAQNSAGSFGGVVSLDNARTEISNSTFTGNDPGTYGEVVSINGGSRPSDRLQITNSILIGNQGDSIPSRITDVLRGTNIVDSNIFEGSVDVGNTFPSRIFAETPRWCRSGGREWRFGPHCRPARGWRRRRPGGCQPVASR